MGASHESDRERYLEEWFPAFVPSENHAPGRFAERVFEALMAANPIKIALKQIGTRCIAIDKIELGGTPLREEVQLRFRVVSELLGELNLDGIRWGGLDEPIKGSLDPVYYFSIDADIAPERVIEDLREFVAEHLEDELIPPASPENAGAARSDAWRDWMPVAVLLIGFIGLIVVATVTVVQVTQHALQLSIALAIGGVIFTALTSIGINGTVRAREHRAFHGRRATNGHSNRISSFFEREEERESGARSDPYEAHQPRLRTDR